MVFAAVTGALLIADLRQPRRFALIFLRPQWGSWLVRGAFILAVYGALALVWLLGGLLDQPDLIRVVALPAALLAAGTAGYTAFLFGQCEGRDLWQTPLLLPILLAQAVAAGAGVLLVLAPTFDLAEPIVTTLLWALVGGAGALVVLRVLRAVLARQRPRRAGAAGHDPGAVRRPLLDPRRGRRHGRPPRRWPSWR